MRHGGLGCTGKGITIAINDSGLELTHEDLAPNIVAGKSFNFITLADDPSPAIPQLTLDHGTGVAGVAAARGWNGKGSRGIAPFASLVGYVSASDASPEIDYLAFGGRSKAGTSTLTTTARVARAALHWPSIARPPWVKMRRAWAAFRPSPR